MFVKPFKRILSDLSGNVGAIFGIMAVPTMIIIGGSIDILRISNSQAKLQSAVEAGVLSAASLSSNQTVEDAVDDYIKANIGDDPTFENLKITIENANLSLNKRVVEVKAEAEVPLTFLQFTGNSVKKIEVSAEAVEAQQTMELSMVLDISSSSLRQQPDAASNLKVAILPEPKYRSATRT